MFFLVFVFYKAVFYFIASSVKLHCFELLDLQMYSRGLKLSLQTINLTFQRVSSRSPWHSREGN